jgi:hypothetical protein
MNKQVEQAIRPIGGLQPVVDDSISPGIWVAASLLVIFFSLRLYFAFQLLPSPVGDSVEELEPIFNYCHSNALVAHLWRLDPGKLDRFDWHGPLPAMLFHWLLPGCTLQKIYIARMVAFLIIPAALLFLVWRQLLPPMICLATCLFALASYEKLQFRPESFALIFVVLAYCAYLLRLHFFEGLLAVCLITTAPVSGAFYCLVRFLFTDFPSLLEVTSTTAGALVGLLVFVILYPFPIKDLIAGLGANVHVTASRSDGSLINGLFYYYVRSDFLPLWGISFILLLVSLAGSAPAIVLAIPFIWYFGFRAPPTNYNLMPLTVALVLLGYSRISIPWRPIVALSLVTPAILGLSQLSLRDAISSTAYPNSYESTRALMSRLLSKQWPIIRSPPFTIFMSPALVDIASNSIPDLKGGHLRGAIVVVPDNGYGRKCPPGSNAVDEDHPKIRFFNSSSSWAVGICKAS